MHGAGIELRRPAQRGEGRRPQLGAHAEVEIDVRQWHEAHAGAQGIALQRGIGGRFLQVGAGDEHLESSLEIG